MRLQDANVTPRIRAFPALKVARAALAALAVAAVAACAPNQAPEAKAGAGAGSQSGSRRVSLGTVPDFGFGGTGVQISGVVPGSAAAA